MPDDPKRPGCPLEPGNPGRPGSPGDPEERIGKIIEIPRMMTEYYPHPSALYLHTIFDQRRVDIIDKVEYGVHDRLHIYPL